MTKEGFNPMSNKGVQKNDSYLYGNDSGNTSMNNSTENHTILYVDKNIGDNHYKDLKTAVEKSEDGSIIYISPGSYKGNNNTQILVNHDLTIVGLNNENKDRNNNSYFINDVIFNGEDHDSFIIVDNGVNLTIQDLTFINGFSGSSGGAINNKGLLSLNHVSFINNRVDSNYITGSNSHNCSDSSNWWDENPEDNDDLEKIGTNNLKASGGAIYSSGIIKMKNSLFENNSAGDYCKGGGIFNDGKLDIENSLFKTNNASGGGGAIYNNKGSLSVDYSTFESNIASSGTSSSGGGAIYASDSNIDVDNSIFTLNGASNSMGGAINNKDSYLSMHNNYFVLNLAESDGGAIYSLRNHGTDIDGCLFYTNIASADGGAIYHKAGENSFNIKNSALINNTANRGGSTYFSDSQNINILNSSLLNNSAINNAGAIYTSKSTTNLFSDEISGNNGTNGGAVYSTGGSLNIKDSLLRDNKASSSGASLYSETDKSKIGNTTFINNTALSNGGALYLSGNDNSISNSTFAVNIALKNGGAIYSEKKLGVYDSIFKTNMASEDGGAIWSGETPTLKNNSYIENTAGKYGGVLLSKEDKPSEKDSSFSENAAGYGGDKYYTQNQKDNAPGITIGTTVAMVAILIIIVVASIFGGEAFSGAIAGPITGLVGEGTVNTVLSTVSTIIIVGGASMGLIFLSDYLFELCPEYKKFNERNPLVMPLITLAIVLISITGIIIQALYAGAAGVNLAIRIGNIAMQHPDDIINVIIQSVKAGADLSSNNEHFEPPNYKEYNNNSSSSNLSNYPPNSKIPFNDEHPTNQNLKP